MEILSFYTCAPQITIIIWCMVSEMKRATDIIFCHFGPFFPFYTPNKSKNQNFAKMKKTPGDIIILHTYTLNDNHIMYGSWDIEYDRWNFLSFYHPNNSKNQNFSKMRKLPGGIITSHKCTINDNHSRYGSWDIERNGKNFLPFWTAFFFPFCILTTPKKQNFAEMKNLPEDITILHMYTLNDNHIMYGSWDTEHEGQNFLSFWTVFCPFIPLRTQKNKISQK